MGDIKKNKLEKIRFWTALWLVLGLTLTGCTQASDPSAVTGVAESKEVDVNSKIPGRVVTLLVKEGDEVKAGQVIARIDGRELAAKEEQAKAQISALEAQAAQAGALTRLQDQTSRAALESAKAQVEKAASDLALAKKSYERVKELFDAGGTTQQSFDEVKNRLDGAQAAYQLAQANQQAAQAGIIQGEINRDNLAATKAKLDQAKGAAQEVGINLAETEIKAPIDGVVTALVVDEGELVSTGMPLLTILDPQDNWINLKVKETELAAYPLKSKISLKNANGDLTLEGEVVDLSKKPEFAAYRATNERGEQDIITYNVKIRTNSPQVRPGMRFLPLKGGE